MKRFYEAVDGTKFNSFTKCIQHEIKQGIIQESDLILKDHKGNYVDNFQDTYELIIKTTEAALIADDEMDLEDCEKPDEIFENGCWIWDNEWIPTSPYVPTMTAEIEAVITACPRSHNGDCKRICPLSVVCQNYQKD